MLQGPTDGLRVILLQALSSRKQQNASSSSSSSQNLKKLKLTKCQRVVKKGRTIFRTRMAEERKCKRKLKNNREIFHFVY